MDKGATKRGKNEKNTSLTISDPRAQFQFEEFQQ